MKYQVVLYMWKINPNINLHWRCDSVSWIKYWMCWDIPEKKGGVEDILFWNLPVEYFIFLGLEIPGKTKLHLWKFYKIVLDSLKIPRPKTKSPGNFTLFFLVTLGNSSLFLINSWKFHMLFFWNPRKFYIPPPTVYFFPGIAHSTPKSYASNV